MTECRRDQIKIIIRMTQLLSAAAAAAVPSIATLIDDAWGMASDLVRQMGDNALQNGHFDWQDGPWRLAVNHLDGSEMKYTTMKTALELLFEEMGQNRWGTCTFWIFDGNTRVGEGEIYRMDKY